MCQAVRGPRSGVAGGRTKLPPAPPRTEEETRSWGFRRYANILKLFSERQPAWTAHAISAALDVPVATVSRHVRELAMEGFLEPAAGGRYRLGPAFIAFDQLIRDIDPVARIGGAVVRDIAAQAPVPNVAVLARLYGKQVVCVAKATAGALVQTSYERGRPQPLLRGAASKAILAQLPSYRLGRILGAPPGPSPRAPLAADLRDELAAIRRRGFCLNRSEVNSGAVGIAAPVRAPERASAASLGLVVEAELLDEAMERRLVLLVVSTAGLLEEELRRVDSGLQGEAPGGSPRADAPRRARRRRPLDGGATS